MLNRPACSAQERPCNRAALAQTLSKRIGSLANRIHHAKKMRLQTQL